MMGFPWWKIVRLFRMGFFLLIAMHLILFVQVLAMLLFLDLGVCQWIKGGQQNYEKE